MFSCSPSRHTSRYYFFSVIGLNEPSPCFIPPPQPQSTEGGQCIMTTQVPRQVRRYREMNGVYYTSKEAGP